MGRFQIRRRALDHCPDVLDLFERVFLPSRGKFLFESSVVTPGFSRFSFMGDAGGPLGETLSYDQHERRLSLRRGEHGETLRVESLFDWLKARLATMAVDADDELPFDFNLGYAGVLGYELKGETGGTRAWRSDTHDAAFVFATRLVAIDHRDARTWLLHLVDGDDAQGEREAEAWFDGVEAQLRASALTVSAARAEAPPRRRLSLAEVENWIARHAVMRHDRASYIAKIREALIEIVNGESYEICLTNLITFAFDRSPFDLYRVLRELSPAPHAAYFEVDGFAHVGASPERFLSVDRHGRAEAKPIKGTRPRGGSAEEDAALIADLRGSEKDRAENLMIVDLLRNDLGQVSRIGSVHVPKLFDVESYSHVHQLVSTIRGELKPGVSSVDCIRAAFPGGSMTGAPKKRTMDIIDRLEEGPRGIYSGSLGWFGLSGACDFNIVIRSVTISEGVARLGVGGAITALSDPIEEFEETIVKARGVAEALRRLEAGAIDGEASAPPASRPERETAREHDSASTATE
ncbi:MULTISPECIES: aminodeoxychorismate synthase component I [unclassified Burkholderia]|uniref:aminodeoxychorismate synthase component I n=1 Tax=unclassified Burkholderia TaxID=2613784 RepID=UPI00142132AE|nr:MULTISPECIES: aminodeoxychorismate synthase component I [unclassified Burkholderia]NIE84498.1 aminodeoxychorismate synthase component I [Burkholderia sp. Tr-860]NIF65355.1 aminodeoxychorismate synthase component I [Burkholderia sp. Cy-647]NIF98221.1 aminodeoxychorismate synthase component I [Burkholderia sp. Ax-1720]